MKRTCPKILRNRKRRIERRLDPERRWTEQEAPWIDRAIEWLGPHADQITLRGDTDSTLNAELDRWDSQDIKFLFGMGAHRKVVRRAEALPKEAWQPVGRLPRYEIEIEPRRKAQRIKEAIVHFKGCDGRPLRCRPK